MIMLSIFQLKQSHLQLGYSELCLDDFLLSLNIEDPQSLWTVCASAQLPSQWGKRVYDVHEEPPVFEFVSTASGCLTGYQWYILAVSSFHLSFKILPWTFPSSGWTVPACSAYFLWKSCSSPVMIFVALCWTFSSICTFFMCAENTNGHSTGSMASPVLRRGKDHHPWPAGNVLHNVACDIISFLWCRVTLWQVLLCKDIFQVSDL